MCVCVCGTLGGYICAPARKRTRGQIITLSSIDTYVPCRVLCGVREGRTATQVSLTHPAHGINQPTKENTQRKQREKEREGGGRRGETTDNQGQRTNKQPTDQQQQQGGTKMRKTVGSSIHR